MERIGATTSLAGRVVEIVRGEITSGRLAPGTRVSAAMLAERIGVSRTPVREALLQLEQAGMVRIERNRGAVVLATTLDDLLEVFEVRLLLEPGLAARAAQLQRPESLAKVREVLAAMRGAADAGDEADLLLLDRDLHLAIAEGADNARAMTVLRSLRDLVLTRGVGTTSTARSGAELVDDHLGLVEAVLAGDAPTAAAEMRRHIANTATLLIVQEAGEGSAFTAESVAERLAWQTAG